MSIEKKRTKSQNFQNIHSKSPDFLTEMHITYRRI